MAKMYPRLVNLAALILMLSFLVACASPGSITGKISYQSLVKPTTAEPLPNIMIALCLVPKGDLPEGPTIATSNAGKTEFICTLQGEPTALSAADGSFTLENVDPGTYLVLFHPFPDKIREMGDNWVDIDLTEGVFNEVNQDILLSGYLDFWETGGAAPALATWSFSEGMTITKGNACSHQYGFCFSILDERMDPVITLESNSSIKVKLNSVFMPKDD